jgi:peptidoglycan/xylan/chitin deacetylase (PgdA/CDA1 family)
MNWKLWFVASWLWVLCSVSFANLPFVIRSVETKHAVVALTFDDGPTKYTDDILEILDNYEAKATFFLIGSRLKRYASYAKQLVAKGHSVGNHSYDHTHINAMSKEDLIKSIAKSQLAFHEYVGVLPSFYRPPYGNVTEVQEKILSKHFSHLIRWGIDPRDWDRNKSDDAIIEHILAKVTAGSIIVLHEKKRTVRLLPQLLEALHQRGFTMVSLDAAIAIAMD